MRSSSLAESLAGSSVGSGRLRPPSWWWMWKSSVPFSSHCCLQRTRGMSSELPEISEQGKDRERETERKKNQSSLLGYSSFYINSSFFLIMVPNNIFNGSCVLIVSTRGWTVPITDVLWLNLSHILILLVSCTLSLGVIIKYESVAVINKPGKMFTVHNLSFNQAVFFMCIFVSCINSINLVIWCQCLRNVLKHKMNTSCTEIPALWLS